MPDKPAESGAKIVCMFLCDGLALVHGKWTAIGIFTSVGGPPDRPLITPPFFIFALINAKPGPHHLKTRLIEARTEVDVIQPNERAILIGPEQDGAYLQVPVGPLKWRPGNYEARLYLDGEWLGETCLDVTYFKEANA